jgi:Symplekin tight junction protein C terminal
MDLSRPDAIPRKPVAAKRPRGASSTPLGFNRPSPEAADMGAMMLMQSMPPAQLINFIMAKLAAGPPDLAALSRRDKRPRTSGPNNKGAAGGNADDKSGGAGGECVAGAMRRAAPRRMTVPTVVAPKLTVESRSRLLHMQCRRILASEARAVASGAAPLRILALARLLTVATADAVPRGAAFGEEVVSHIVDGLPATIELALAWLHAEAACSFQPGGCCRLPAAGERPDEESALALLWSARDDSRSAVATLAADAPAAGDTAASGEAEAADVQVKVEEALPPAADAGAEKGAAGGAAVPGSAAESAGAERAGGPPAVVEHAQPSPSADENEGVAARASPVDEPSPVGEEEAAAAGPVALGSRYDALLVAMLKKAAAVLEPEDRVFSRLLVEAPVIPDPAIDVVAADCRDAARSRVGLSTLRDIVLERPGPDRDRSLAILLRFTIDEDDIVRGPAIRLVVSKLFEDMTGHIPDAVEAFAVKVVADGIERAKVAQAGEDPPSCAAGADGGDGADVARGPDTAALDRNLWILTALCAKKASLLAQFSSTYVRAPAAARPIILARAKDVAGQLGPESEALLSLVRGEDERFAGDSEELGDLALAVAAASMAKAGPLPPDCLVDAVRLRYDRTKDARLLLSVLTGLRRNQLLTYLPVLVAADGESAGGFQALITKVMGARPQIIDADDLLVELHMLPCTQHVCAALRTCFEMRGIFRQDVVATALLKILEASFIPDLLMRTVLLTRRLYPGLDAYIRETVILGTHGVLRKRVWEQPMVWKGFVTYCADVEEASLTALVRLPFERLVEVLSTHDALRKVVQGVLADEVIRINGRDRSFLTGALQTFAA